MRKKIIIKIAKEFPIKIVQQTNERNITNLEKFYSENKIENTIFNYDKNFINKILETDLCITRSGSSTLAELSITNTPFVAVPLATSKDNHQLENANFYKNKGCCWLLEQSVFEEEIEQLLKDILKVIFFYAIDLSRFLFIRLWGRFFSLISKIEKFSLF